MLPAVPLPKCSLLCPDSSFQQSRGWEEELWGRCSQQPLPSAPQSKGLGVVWQQMSSNALQEGWAWLPAAASARGGRAGSVQQPEVLWHPGKHRHWTCRSAVCASPYCTVLCPRQRILIISLRGAQPRPALHAPASLFSPRVSLPAHLPGPRLCWLSSFSFDKVIVRWNAEWLLASLQPKHPHPVEHGATGADKGECRSGQVSRAQPATLQPHDLEGCHFISRARVCVCVRAQAVFSHPQEMFSASLVFSLGQTHMHVARDQLRTDSFDEQGLNIYLAFQRQRAERGRGCESVCLTNSGGSRLSAGPGDSQERNVKEFFTSLFCFVFLFCFPSESAFLALVKGA